MAIAESRLPPQNMEAEQSVLGGILIDNQAFHRVVDALSPEDFYRPANGKIFAAMCELASKSEPIDVVTMTSKLKELGAYEEVGGAAYLAELLERVPTAMHVEYHARLVADQAVKRRLVSTCNEIANRGLDPVETTEELLDEAERSIFGLTSSRKTRGVTPVRDIVRSAFEQLETRYANQGKLTGIPSGYTDLDKLTSGFQRTDLIIVACRPSVGKTSFSLGVTRAAAKSKAPVAFFSLEMSKESIVTRLLAAEAKVDSGRLRTGQLSDHDWTKLTRAAGTLSEAPIYIDDTPALTVLEVRGKARRLKSEIGGELGMIIVDYLQIMGTSKHAQSRENAISEISRQLKALAKELNVPVIALSQVNRNIDLRQDKRPMMADLRESGAIEQDADLIIFLHRETGGDAQNPNAMAPAEFIVAKHRNGRTDTVKVAWLGQYTSFENLAANVEA